MARLESVQNAVDQARCFAEVVCGRPRPYNAVPWFWTDQFSAKLQMVGISQGFDCEVTRGDMGAGNFSVCYFRAGRLIAIDSVNRPADHLAGRKLIAHGGETVTPEQAADVEFDLKAAETQTIPRRQSPRNCLVNIWFGRARPCGALWGEAVRRR